MLPTLSWRGTLATAAAITASSFAGASTATAAACVFNDDGGYFANGFSCSTADVTFSDFRYDRGTIGADLQNSLGMSPQGSGLGVGISYCISRPAFHSITFTVAAAAGREIVGMNTAGFFSPFESSSGQVGSFEAAASNGAVADASLTIPGGTPGLPRFPTRFTPAPTDAVSFDGVDSLTVTITMFSESMPMDGGIVGFTLADKPAVTPVPEPASLALFGIGLTGLAALRTRRRARTGESVH